MNHKAFAAIGVATVLAAAGCGGASKSAATVATSPTPSASVSSPAAPTTPAAAAPTVITAHGSHGVYLVAGAANRALYLFEKDSPNTSACTASCPRYWPPLLVTGTPTAGAGVSSAQLGVITRADGTKQVTYNGHPLYTFALDSTPGDTNGQALNEFGAKWYLIAPSGSKIGA